VFCQSIAKCRTFIAEAKKAFGAYFQLCETATLTEEDGKEQCKATLKWFHSKSGSV
jgi:hypothetical protein